MFKGAQVDLRTLAAVTSAIAITTAVAVGIFMLSVDGFGMYGCALFIAMLFLAGFVPPAFLAARRVPMTLVQNYCVALAVGIILIAWLLVRGVEGLICIVLALPLAMPLHFLGVCAAFRLFHAYRLPQATTAIALLLVVSFGYLVAEASVVRVPKTQVVEHAMLVNAEAPDVWQTIVSLDEVPPSTHWMFRAGVACPQRARIVDGRDGGVRVCTLTTGRLFERIDAWHPNQRLSWTTLSTPPPMKELNPFAEVDAPHLHGYYRSVRGEFELQSVRPGVTRVIRRTWYQHDFLPGPYWAFWCDRAAARIHFFVLDHVRTSAESRTNPKA